MWPADDNSCKPPLFALIGVPRLDIELPWQSRDQCNSNISAEAHGDPSGTCGPPALSSIPFATTLRAENSWPKISREPLATRQNRKRNSWVAKLESRSQPISLTSPLTSARARTRQSFTGFELFSGSGAGWSYYFIYNLLFIGSQSY